MSQLESLVEMASVSQLASLVGLASVLQLALWAALVWAARRTACSDRCHPMGTDYSSALPCMDEHLVDCHCKNNRINISLAIEVPISSR